MSDVSGGEGWWEASDGKWYRPELRPDDRPPPPVPTWPPPPTGEDRPAPPSGEPILGSVPVSASTPDANRPLYKRLWFLTACGVVLVAIVVAAIASTGNNSKPSASGVTAGTNASSTSPPSTSPPPTSPPPTAPPPSVPPTFAGTAHPTFTSGTPGSLEVIDVGSPNVIGSGDGTEVPVEVWNGTLQSVSGVDISGPAMSGSTVVGSGDSQDVEPGVLDPGEVAFGMVFYTQDLPSGVTFTLTATGSTDTASYQNARVVQANYSASGGLAGGPDVVGTVTNPGIVSITYPVPTDLYCFSSTGVLLSVGESFVDGNAGLAPGASGSYAVDVPTDSSGSPLPCPTFLVGSSGTT